MQNQIRERIKSKTPPWFKKIMRICIALAAVGVALLTSETQVPGFELPPFIEKLAQWFTVAGIVGAAIAKTAKSDE